MCCLWNDRTKIKERSMVKNSYFGRLLIKILFLAIIGGAVTACKEKTEIVDHHRFRTGHRSDT
jgi:hypothetical protein